MSQWGYMLRKSDWRFHRRLQLGLELGLVLAAVLGIAALMLEYGFRPLPHPFSRGLLHDLELLAALMLVAHRVGHWALDRFGLPHVRAHWAISPCWPRRCWPWRSSRWRRGSWPGITPFSSTSC